MTEVKQYESTLFLPRDLTIDSVEFILAKIRERAGATLVTDEELPTLIRIDWTLEEGEDGWDLRETLQDVRDAVEDNLCSELTWDRPKPKAAV